MDYDDETLKELGRLAVKLGANKDTGRSFRKLIKQVEPNRKFPSDEVEELREQVEADRERDKLEAAQRETLRKLEVERDRVAQKHTGDEMKEIEAVMEKYGLTSYEAGAKIYRGDKPPALPQGQYQPGASEQFWSLPQADGLFENPEKFARSEAAKVIDEFRSRSA